MRFSWDDAAPGLANAFRTLGGGGYARGQDHQLKIESAIAKALWDAEQAKASAAASEALAAQRAAQTEILTRRPDLVNELMANQAGMSVPGFVEARGRRAQGLPARVFDSGTQSVIDPTADSAVSRALQQGLPLLGAEHWNPEQIADARGKYQGQFRLEDVQAGRVPLEQYQAEQFAARGNPRFGVQGNTIVDQLRGVQGPTQVGQAEIARDRAAAERSRAGAAAEGYKLVEGVDEQGKDDFEFVQVRGGPKGEKPTTRLKPRARREAEDLAVDSEYRLTFGQDPTMRPKGAPAPVTFKSALQRFSKDPAMQGAQRGQWVIGKGFEVYRDGKLIGHYE